MESNALHSFRSRRMARSRSPTRTAFSARVGRGAPKRRVRVLLVIVLLLVLRVLLLVLVIIAWSEDQEPF